MVAFKIESWIWYAVVLLIAGSRLLVSQAQAHAHAHMHKSPFEPKPNAQRPKQARCDSITQHLKIYN